MQNLRSDQSKDEDADGQGQPGMQALTRGLLVVELVAEAEQPMRFTDILEASNLPKGTLHRLLQTLVDTRFLRLDPRDQSYRLGSRPFQLAHRVWDQFDLRGASEPELLRLRDLTGETIRLGVHEAGEVLYIDQRELPRPLRIANGVGSRAALHSSALGKAIAAHLSSSERAELFQKEMLQSFTEHTIVSLDDLDKQLNLIKARGYAISVQEQHEDISAVAAPILDHRAAPIGAIGIVGPSSRLTEDVLNSLGREVIEAARRISGNIGEIAMPISVNQRPLGIVRDDLDCAFAGAEFLAEGPFWDATAQRLIWVDILAPAVLSGDPATSVRSTVSLPELVGVAVPRAKGGLLLATESGIRFMDPVSGHLTTLAAPEADKPGNRFNDGKCDARGRFWVGSLAIDTTPGRGALWRIDPDGASTKMDEGFHISNGMGWSPDNKTFYFTDSASREIYAYDFDLERGTIANRRVFARLQEGEGTPDGLSVDSAGHVWVAYWDGWCITRFDPAGQVERVINLPVPRPTSCTFGGPELDTLFITTARIRLSAQQLADAPLSGSVLSYKTGVRGLPGHAFAG